MPNTQSHWDPKTLNHRFWILAVSLSIATGKGIAPALPALQKAFSDYPATMINLLATIPQIPALIVLLFSGQLANRFGIKKGHQHRDSINGCDGCFAKCLNQLLANFYHSIAFRNWYRLG
ncbi:hypothetical protein [Fructobacillus tropaeoli]|uniref:hypothetical protein n=1 Tax=Fructobacillus tropaeoli TaxID=709323 RepID=UPI0030C7FD58